MKNLRESATNRKQVEHLHGVLQTALERVLRPGYHGSIHFELVVRDGVIQEILEQQIVRHRKSVQ